MDRFRIRHWAQGEASPSSAVTTVDGAAANSSSDASSNTNAPGDSPQGSGAGAPAVPDFRLGAVEASAANSSVRDGTSRTAAPSGQPALGNGFFHQQQHHGMSTPTGNNKPSPFHGVINKNIVDGGDGSSSDTGAQEKSSASSTPQTEAPSPRSGAFSDSSYSPFPYSFSPSPSAAAAASSSSEPSPALPTSTSPPASQFRPSHLSSSASSTPSTTSRVSLSSGASSVDSSVVGKRLMLLDPDVQCASGREEVGRVDSIHSNQDAAEMREGFRSGGDSYGRQQGGGCSSLSPPSPSGHPSSSPSSSLSSLSSSGRPPASSSSGKGKKRAATPQPRGALSTRITDTAGEGSLGAASARRMRSSISPPPLDTIMEDHDPFDELSAAEDETFASAAASTQKVRYRQLAVREGFARSHSRLLQHDTGFNIQDEVDRLLDCTRSLLDDMGFEADAPASAATEEDAVVFQQETQVPLDEATTVFRHETQGPLLWQGGASAPLASGDNSGDGSVDSRSSSGAAIEPPSKATAAAARATMATTDGGEGAGDAMDVSEGWVKE